jgi:hypothetical protein
MTYHDLIKKIKKYMKVLFIGTFTIFLISLAHYVFSPKLYMSEAIFEIRETSNSNQNSLDLGGFSSLANIGGVLGGAPTSDFNKVMEKIESRDIANNILSNEGILAFLIAAKTYKKDTDEIIYNKNIYDKNNEKFVNEHSTMSRNKLLELGYQEYLKVLSISENQNGFLNIRVSSLSPKFSKNLIELVKMNINKNLSSIKRQELEDSLNYMSLIINQSDDVNIRSALINEQLNIQRDLMTLNIRKDYAITYIDSPNIPISIYSPRILFSILFFIIASFFYSIFVVIFFED